MTRPRTRPAKSGQEEAPTPESPPDQQPNQQPKVRVHPFCKSLAAQGFPMCRRSDVRAAEYNPRFMDLSAKVNLKNQLRSFGLVEPIVVNPGTGHVVGGHQRMAIMDEEVGFNPADPATDYLIPVAKAELTEAREKILNVALNNPGSQGWWDYTKLVTLARDEKSFDAELAGFDLTSFKQDVMQITPDLWKPEDFTHIFGEPEPDDAAADAESIRGMKATKQDYRALSGELGRDGFYLMVVFRVPAEKEKFCEALGVSPNAKHAEGRVVAERLGIDIGYEPPADPHQATENGQGSPPPVGTTAENPLGPTIPDTTF